MEASTHFEYAYEGRAFRIGSWSCTCPRPDPGAEEYTPYFEMVFVRSGAFVKHLGRRRVFADPNHVIFFNPGEAYRVSHPVSGGDECTIFFVSPESASELLAPDSIDLDSGRPSLSSPRALVDSRSYSLHRQLVRLLANDGEVDRLAVDEIGIDLIDRVLATATRSPEHSERGERPGTLRDRRRAVDAAMQLLSADFTQPLTLDDVAEATHYSKFHLARLFKKETGLPIHRYLNRLRLRAALERLMEPAEDLSRLALEVGFSSHSHFSHAFRLEFGRTPSELRRTGCTRDLRELSKDLERTDALPH